MTSLEQAGGWPGVLGRLFRSENLTAEEAEAALHSILLGEAASSQVAAFAAALRTKGETAEEMTGLVRAMRAHSVPLDLGRGIVDTCGTGGDLSGTINVSTMAAVVVAAAGCRVVKHGGRAASSRSGSADVFEALGVAVDLGPVGVARCVESCGIGFCLAPRFHPAMRFAAPVRRELAVPTIFNFLGPLANPAGATRQLVGVGDPKMAEKMLAVLESNGVERAMVVHGNDGLDELSTTAPTAVLETLSLAGGAGYDRSRYEVDATRFGLAAAVREDLAGGSPAENAAVAGAVFAGEHGRRRDFVVLNAAAGLVVAGRVADIGEGVELAGSLIDDGRAAATLSCLVSCSHEEKARELR